MTVTKTYCDRCRKEVIRPVERRLYLSGLGREGGYDLCNSCYDELCNWFIEKDKHETMDTDTDADEYKYCPNCGAYMRESEDNDIKTTLNEIHGIHERIRQCNERYEKRMAELERPVEFYDINGPLKITREEDNNG